MGGSGRELSAAPGVPVSRRRLALRASALEVIGFGSSQAIRLASNLVLTRLLTPAEFGLALLVALFLSGLEMVSDLGFQAAVVQNRHGDEQRFVDTAWTLQIGRGIVLCLAGLALAGPIAGLYGEAQLEPLLHVASVQALLSGFNSTAVFTLRRHVRVGPLVLLDLGGQLVNTAVMVGWALVSPTVWALIGGGVANTLFRLALSHRLPVPYRNRLAWDREAVAGILHFGKWIFGSSLLHFAGRQGDRLIVGKLLGVSLLGVYSLATLISDLVGSVIERITHGVFFPLFSGAARESTAELKRVFYAARLRMDLAAMPALGALVVLGPWVVDLLWDERWSEAGWMLRFLAFRVAMASLLAPCETSLFALGETRFGFYRSVARTAWVLLAVPVGFWVAETSGILVAMALS